jgi:hypothetical protein
MKTISRTQLTLDNLPDSSTMLGLLKTTLVRRFTNEFSDLSTAIIRRAVEEADTVAQSTGFPHLVLPLLAEEYVRQTSELSFSGEPAGDAALAVA